jgi:hypothetical protein
MVCYKNACTTEIERKKKTMDRLFENIAGYEKTGCGWAAIFNYAAGGLPTHAGSPTRVTTATFGEAALIHQAKGSGGWGAEDKALARQALRALEDVENLDHAGHISAGIQTIRYVGA